MKSMEQDQIEGHFHITGCITAMATVNCNDGKWSKKILFDNKQFVLTKFYFQLNKNETLIYGQMDKTVSIGRLKY